MKARRAAVGLALVLTLAGCSSEHAPSSPRVPRQTGAAGVGAAPTPQLVIDAVKGLCDFFVARAHETLLKAEAEGNVTLMRTTPGFPADLNDYARAYYLINATDPIDASERARLDAAYARVITSCQAHGWKG